MLLLLVESSLGLPVVELLTDLRVGVLLRDDVESDPDGNWDKDDEANNDTNGSGCAVVTLWCFLICDLVLIEFITRAFNYRAGILVLLLLAIGI